MSRVSALYLTLCGATCMSFVGLMIRLINEADGFQILFYRSFGMSAIILLVISLKRKINPLIVFKSIDKDDLLMGAFFSLAFLTYVFSMLNTSIASTLFLLSMSPIFAGLIGWVWIREKPKKIVWLSMFIALIGVFIMIGDGLKFSKTFGNLLAILSAIFFALGLVQARKSKKDDVLGGTLLGAVFSCILGFVITLILDNGLMIEVNDILISLFMGFFTIGLGIALVTWATPYLPAAEISLLVLLESILGPIWVWYFLNEIITLPEIVGGFTVLCAVILMIYVNKPVES